MVAGATYRVMMEGSERPPLKSPPTLPTPKVVAKEATVIAADPTSTMAPDTTAAVASSATMTATAAKVRVAGLACVHGLNAVAHAELKVY